MSCLREIFGQAHNLHTRREIITRGAQGAAIVGLVVAVTNRRPTIETTSPHELNDYRDLREVWGSVDMDEYMNQTAASYTPFGLTREAALVNSGTLRFYNKARNTIFGIGGMTRADLLRGKFASKKLKPDTVDKIFRPQLAPLVDIETNGEESMADEYAKKRNDMVKPLQIADGVSRMSAELFQVILDKINELEPGIGSCLVGIEPAPVDADGYHASALRSKGIIRVRTDVPPHLAITPRMIIHELAHLMPHQILEYYPDIETIENPERIAHFDPRILLQVRKQINEILAQLVEDVTQKDADPAYSKMSITAGKRKWIKLLTGMTMEDFEKTAQDGSVSNAASVDAQFVASKELRLLEQEIGSQNARKISQLMINHLDSDPWKMRYLQNALRQHPNSTVLQKWAMSVLDDLEHYIIDPEMSYCDERKCRTSKLRLANSRNYKTTDPRINAAMTYAEKIFRLSSPSNSRSSSTTQDRIELYNSALNEKIKTMLEAALGTNFSKWDFTQTSLPHAENSVLLLYEARGSDRRFLPLAKSIASKRNAVFSGRCEFSTIDRNVINVINYFCRGYFVNQVDIPMSLIGTMHMLSESLDSFKYNRNVANFISLANKLVECQKGEKVSSLHPENPETLQAINSALNSFGTLISCWDFENQKWNI